MDNVWKDCVIGCGIDVGTSNVVVTRQKKDGTFVSKTHRDMLYPLDISDESADLLKRSDYLFVKSGDKFYIVGEDALRLVNAIGKGEVVRPMRNGILNPSLKESSELLFYIIKAVVGDPLVSNEPLRFSLPANPIDADLDNRFHQMVLQSFFTKLGYTAKPINEAMAIAYDCNPVMKPIDKEDKPTPLSGITCSCGAGMWNLALVYKGLSLVEFSCTKSGDFLDEQVAKATGISSNKVMKIKERYLDLDKVDADDRVKMALSIYYDEMVDRMVHHIAKGFRDKSSEMEGEIEIVVAGGTAMAPGFTDRLKAAVARNPLPFKVYAVRLSDHPFYSVGQGACIRARADASK